MNIIHISDIHFGNVGLVYLKSELKRAIADFIKELGTENFVLVISGDITYQGSRKGFEEAKDFFNEIIYENNLDRNRILACPGNHDIIKMSLHGFHHLTILFTRLEETLFAISQITTLFLTLSTMCFFY